MLLDRAPGGGRQMRVAHQNGADQSTVFENEKRISGFGFRFQLAGVVSFWIDIPDAEYVRRRTFKVLASGMPPKIVLFPAALPPAIWPW